MPNVPNPDLGGLPAPTDPWCYSSRMLDALQAAAVMHAAQRRKGDGRVPYLAHLMAVSSIVLDYGGSEDEAIAALLHDSLEDIRPAGLARPVVAGFGPEVLAIVEGCTDGEPDSTGRKEAWEVRKERYIGHVAAASASVLLVSAADKLHNARTTVTDLRASGPAALDKFKASRAQTIWYYEELVKAFTKHPLHNVRLIEELARTVAEMRRLSGV